MGLTRGKYEGVRNIFLFNKHFYIAGVSTCLLLFVLSFLAEGGVQLFLSVATIVAFYTVFSSIAVSHYVYDKSDLYAQQWLPDLNHHKVLIVNAGFDEVSKNIQAKFPACEITVADFYDSTKHTERSIKLAREMYPSTQEVVSVQTTELPFEADEFDCVISFLAAHEIRNDKERVQFFKEINRVINHGGQVFITEHLRDGINFLAYSLGAFHFIAKSKWLQTFKLSGFQVINQLKVTPFITTFILQND